MVDKSKETFSVAISSHYYDDFNKEWRIGSYMGVKVYQSDIEKVKQALDLLGIKAWRIQTSEGFGTDIEISPLVKEVERRQKEESDKHNAKMRKLASEFNKLPNILKTWKFRDIIIVLKRGEAKYDPSQSRHVNAAVEYRIKFKKSGDYYFNPKEWITSDGKVQKKKFFEWLSSFIGRTLHRTLHHNGDYLKEHFEVYTEIVKTLKEMRQVRSDYRKKYGMRY